MNKINRDDYDISSPAIATATAAASRFPGGIDALWDDSDFEEVEDVGKKKKGKVKGESPSRGGTKKIGKAQRESPSGGGMKKKSTVQRESPGIVKRSSIQVEVPDTNLDGATLIPEFGKPTFGPWPLEPLPLEIPDLDPDEEDNKTNELRLHLAPIRERCAEAMYQVPASIARYLGIYQQRGVEFMFRTIYLNGGGILGDGKCDVYISCVFCFRSML
jgi:hypothetical protein